MQDWTKRAPRRCAHALQKLSCSACPSREWRVCAALYSRPHTPHLALARATSLATCVHFVWPGSTAAAPASLPARAGRAPASRDPWRELNARRDLADIADHALRQLLSLKGGTRRVRLVRGEGRGVST